VICLLSALDVYMLTDANPEHVFVALPQGRWTPQVIQPPVQVVQYSRRLFLLGREETVIGGRTVALFSRKKTLCDCFRLPELIGLDLALSALRRYLRSSQADVSALLAMAEQCRAALAPLCGGPHYLIRRSLKLVRPQRGARGSRRRHGPRPCKTACSTSPAVRGSRRLVGAGYSEIAKPPPSQPVLLAHRITRPRLRR
jgi:hypothetical protein